MLCVCVGCTVEAALEAASLHPAQLLGVSHKKGTLEYGADAGKCVCVCERNIFV